MRPPGHCKWCKKPMTLADHMAHLPCPQSVAAEQVEGTVLRGNTEAETCRLNGWNVGTVLVGDEGYGPEKIKITAIGEESTVAKRIENHRGEQIEVGE